MFDKSEGSVLLPGEEYKRFNLQEEVELETSQPKVNEFITFRSSATTEVTFKSSSVESYEVVLPPPEDLLGLSSTHFGSKLTISLTSGKEYEFIKSMCGEQAFNVILKSLENQLK